MVGGASYMSVNRRLQPTIDIPAYSSSWPYLWVLLAWGGGGRGESDLHHKVRAWILRAEIEMKNADVAACGCDHHLDFQVRLAPLSHC